MQLLGIPNSTYYLYKAKIYEESKKLWQQTVSKELEYRALMLKEYLQLQTRVNESIALDQAADPRARIEASEKMVNGQLRLFLILRDGPSLA